MPQDVNATCNQFSAVPSVTVNVAAIPLELHQVKLTGKRYRRPHSMQVEIPTSKKFAEDRGEELSTGIWSEFETVVLNEVINTLKDDDNEEDMYKVYNDVVRYSKSNCCSTFLPEKAVFRTKTASQIKRKLDYSFDIRT